ncbi:MAG TPA: BPSS1780 family membrane protein [Usitatibacteraceae bacterium]|nr:BPSS1780 family membrane protein [Usitatibacteraceae bacterium]
MDSAIRVRDVRSSRGPAWIAGGWRLFRGATVVWMGLSAGWMLITFGLVLVPVIGGVAANLMQPVFFSSFALAAHKQLAGTMPQMGDLFAGFRRPLRPLINLGAILLIAEIAIFFLMSLLGLPGVSDGDEVPTIADYVRKLQGKEWILLVGLLLTALVKGALWFAPAILAFHDLSTAHAVRWSVYAALSNLGAMLAYGIALTVAFFAGVLPWGLGLLVVVPVMLASSYSGYADVFEDAVEAPSAA